jgi:hypothetical protein
MSTVACPDGIFDEVMQPVNGGIVIVRKSFTQRGGMKSSFRFREVGGEEGFHVPVVGS